MAQFISCNLEFIQNLCYGSNRIDTVVGVSKTLLTLFSGNYQKKYKGGTSLSSVVETVTELVTPFLAEKNFYLVDVEFVKEGSNWYLRLFIDKDGGIDIDECVEVSEYMSDQLDALDPDPIPQAYFLEVSSPGAERPLKKADDYQKALGEYIHVSLYTGIDGEKQWEGTLETCDEETLTLSVKIKTRTKVLTIPRSNIAKARLAIKF